MFGRIPIPGLDQSRYNKACRELDYLEKIPFGMPQDEKIGQIAKGKFEKIQVHFDSLRKRISKGSKSNHLETLAKVKNQIEKFKRNRYFPKTRLRQLEFRARSLEYRLGEENGGVSPLPEEKIEQTELYKKLSQSALEWKKGHRPCRKKTLTERDQARLKELACYPNIMNALLKEEEEKTSLRKEISTLKNSKVDQKRIKSLEKRLKQYGELGLNHCFKWTIKCHLSGHVYMQYPSMSKKLDDKYLKGRIGKNIPEGLKIDTSKGYKDLTLLFETKEGQKEPISILDGSRKVTLIHDLTYTIDQIFKIFEDKNLIEGHLSVKHNGITNCSQNHLGAPIDGKTKKPIPYDLDGPDLFSKLKRKFLTVEEAKTYFNKLDPRFKHGFTEDSLNGKDLVFTVVVSRQSDRLDVFGAHAYLYLWVPTDDGYIITHGIGKFTDYPQNCLESIGILSKVGLASFQCQDNNQEYTHREHIKKHYRLTPERGIDFLNSLRKDFKSAQEGTESFQILNDNCTDWIYRKIEDFVGPDESANFEVKFMELEPSGIVAVVFKIAKLFSEKNRNRYFYVMTILLGGLRKLKIRNKKICILDNPPWKRKFRHPAQFARYILGGSSSSSQKSS